MTDQSLRRPPIAHRTEGLSRLQAFLPHAGRDYAARRNYDLPEAGHPHVSQLSPYIRHRLVTEQEAVSSVLARHSLSASEKYVQEVFWRTYWKGWLEMRPTIWGEYRQRLDQTLNRLDAQTAEAIARAEAGETDIEAFNAWAQELTQTGYLHNHARMWFASIWIFTLRLPWEVGADFFMQHLLDGDAASNTLSWRWVGGLQTKGKAYVARSSNISKYTEGRHNPGWQLNTEITPLDGPAPPARTPIPESGLPLPGRRTGLLIHEDDLDLGEVVNAIDGPLMGYAVLETTADRSLRPISPHVGQFAQDAVRDVSTRWAARIGCRGPVAQTPEPIVNWAAEHGLEQVVTPYAPVGPAARALRRLQRQLEGSGIDLIQVEKGWDQRAWPHATAGFFKFKEKIPQLIQTLG